MGGSLSSLNDSRGVDVDEVSGIGSSAATGSAAVAVIGCGAAIVAAKEGCSVEGLAGLAGGCEVV